VNVSSIKDNDFRALVKLPDFLRLAPGTDAEVTYRGRRGDDGDPVCDMSLLLVVSGPPPVARGGTPLRDVTTTLTFARDGWVGMRVSLTTLRSIATLMDGPSPVLYRTGPIEFLSSMGWHDGGGSYEVFVTITHGLCSKERPIVVRLDHLRKAVCGLIDVARAHEPGVEP
jgi:hypothetical protein